LTVTIPVNGARTTVSSRLRCASASRATATSTARIATSRLVRVESNAVFAVSKLCALITARVTLLFVALERWAGVLQRDLGCEQIRLALLELGTCLPDRGLRVRVVESCDHIASLDALTFLDGDGDDFAVIFAETVACRRATT